jgi:hypothetical protein
MAGARRRRRDNAGGGNRPRAGHELSGRPVFAIMALDVQMLLGLLLYLAVSPNMQPILADFGAAMKDPTLRFWAVEHLVTMFAAIAIAHVGRALARKAATPAARRTRLMVCFGLSTVLMIIGMPWPGRPGGRQLFRI